MQYSQASCREKLTIINCIMEPGSMKGEMLVKWEGKPLFEEIGPTCARSCLSDSRHAPA